MTNDQLKQADRSTISFNEIRGVISIITDISAQTNLLALNASIEAGTCWRREVCCVADEVRKLAEQSADAAKTVSDLVIGTQENSQRVLESVKAVKQWKKDVSKWKARHKILL
ncbi:methyl-accepting chemotaxis protein [Bacillus sp. SL00103]